MKYQKSRSKKVGISGAISVSELEIDIMNIGWSMPKITVREVHEELIRQDLQIGRQDLIPYTTVMSTMLGLSEKGLLKIDKRKKTYYYSTALSRQELSARIIETVAEKLLGRRSKLAVSKFLSNAENINKKNIDSLLKEIDRL